MNKFHLILKGSNKNMASFEFEELFKTYYSTEIKLREYKNILYYFDNHKSLDKSSEIFKRLTFTNYLGIEIFRFNSLNEFKTKLSDKVLSQFNFKSFLVRLKKYKSGLNSEFSEKDIAEIIWDKLENPKVDLFNPEMEFTILLRDDCYILCETLYNNSKDYLNRMPKKRPVQMPYTLKSDMARASINFLGISDGVVLDPFCGIGGILLEAYDMGFNIIGNDISWNDLKYMKTNFSYYYPNYKPNILLSDSRYQFLKDNSVDGIVSDIPYGKSSRMLGLELYEKFLISSSKMLKKNSRMVIIFANFVEFRDLALKYFNEVKTINQYINKSMTRHIIVLENTK